MRKIMTISVIYNGLFHLPTQQRSVHEPLKVQPLIDS